MPHVHQWTEVLDVPYEGGPSLPTRPRTPPRTAATAPARLLGPHGTALWERVWATSTSPPNEDRLLHLCEQVDERQGLRYRVIEVGEWRDRLGLRQLDKQIADGLVYFADREDRIHVERWPAATRRWWTAVSRLPHCRLWTDGDWQFAQDTARLVAEFHAGNLSLSKEIRMREAVMGTTRDARRDLRIRYVDELPDDAPGPNLSVTAMADYRRNVTAEDS